MSMIGFNADLVSATLTNIANSYDEIVEVLGNKMQAQYINEMGKCWACNAAKKYFDQAFKPTLEGLNDKINEKYDGLYKVVAAAAKAWAQETKTNYFPPSFSITKTSLDTSVIHENINGDRGIIPAYAQSATNRMGQLFGQINEAIEKTIQITQECGFVGGGQADAYIADLKEIQILINNALDGISQAAQNTIRVTIDNYGDLAAKVAQAFSGN